VNRNTSSGRIYDELNDPVIELNDPRLDPPPFSMDELLADPTYVNILDEFIDGSRTRINTLNLDSDHDLLYHETGRFLDRLEAFVNAHNADIRELWDDFYTINYSSGKTHREMIGSKLFWEFCLHLYLKNRSYPSK
jgi:hypothetical protein